MYGFLQHHTIFMWYQMDNRRRYIQRYSTGENLFWASKWVTVMYCIDCKLFITNNIAVIHFLQAYWISNIFIMNFLKIFFCNETDWSQEWYSERSKEAQAIYIILAKKIPKLPKVISAATFGRYGTTHSSVYLIF